MVNAPTSFNGQLRRVRRKKCLCPYPLHIHGIQFHLYKENKDTQEALWLLGKMIGIQPRSFGFAGTKDKQSVSTQRVTVFKQRANSLAALNEKLVGIKLGNFCHVNDGLLLGQLQGNRFTITLREIVNYTDTDAPLVKTDCEIAKSSPDTYGRDEREQNKWQADMKLKPHKVGNKTEMPTETMQLEDLSKTQESLTALKLSFTLPASSYATMVMRELLKTSTSVAFHKTLNLDLEGEILTLSRRIKLH